MNFHPVPESAAQTELMGVEPTGEQTTQTREILTVASSKEAIFAWMNQSQCGYWGDVEYKLGDNQVLVLSEIVGFGLPIYNMYIFCKLEETKEWYLVLYRTAGTQMEVRQEGDKFIFTDKLANAKGVVLEQSLEILFPSGK